MKYGMLWFDNDPKTDLPAKITRAAAFYERKYGIAPTVCIVNPAMTEKKKLLAGSIQVKTNPSILPNHLWIGADS